MVTQRAWCRGSSSAIRLLLGHSGWRRTACSSSSSSGGGGGGSSRVVVVVVESGLGVAKLNKRERELD